MPPIERCREVYLNHAANETSSLSDDMMIMWLKGQTYCDLGMSSAEPQSGAKRSLEVRVVGSVNLISQKEDEHDYT